MNLLVVDDEPAVCTVLQLLLAREGHGVTVCHDGTVALDILAHTTPDLALIDLNLPLVNGMSVIAAVRNIRPNVPIIIITGMLSTSSSDPRDHPEIGALAGAYCLAKPFKPRDLSCLVARVLSPDAGSVSQSA